MKRLIVVLTLFCILPLFSQAPREIAVSTEVNEVTVFVENAQITRKKSVQIQPGTSVLKFTNLSPFIIANSIQAKIEGNITILAINHQQEFLDKLQKSAPLIELEARLAAVQDELDVLVAEAEVLNEEIAFLNANRSIGGNGAVSVTALKEASEYYRSRLLQLKRSLLENKSQRDKLQEKIAAINDQISTVSGVKDFANGSILVKIESERAAEIDVELSYIVQNAGWLPFYDIKAKNINSPLQLVYKAKVKQDTKIDWKDVKLKFSTAEPNLSGQVPELRTYYLNYHSQPPVYAGEIKQVSGVVLDENWEPLPGANVVVQGTTIGTSTDFDGRYNLSIPNQNAQLEFSYIGFITQLKAINSPVINVALEEDNALLEEVVVTAYGTSGNRRSRARKVADTAPPAPKPASTPIPIAQIQRQTTVEFEIDIPYSLPSDNISYTVDMADYEVGADFKYISIPKVEPAAYLVASILGWEQYNLLEGEANLIFENTFVGKTLLQLRSASDTLQLSLGRDKNIVVKRKKVTDYNSKPFIGSKREEVREWNISIKNNKTERVQLEVYDQIPKSTLDEISVEVEAKSGATVNEESGEVKWTLSLDPKESQELNLEYSVKYPRNKRLFVE